MVLLNEEVVEKYAVLFVFISLSTQIIIIYVHIALLKQQLWKMHLSEEIAEELPMKLLQMYCGKDMRVRLLQCHIKIVSYYYRP